MENNTDIFSEEYSLGVQTKDEILKEKEDKEDEIEIDLNNYTIGKPVRKILRARLIHD